MTDEEDETIAGTVPVAPDDATVLERPRGKDSAPSQRGASEESTGGGAAKGARGSRSGAGTTRVTDMQSASEFMANEEAQRLHTFSTAMLFVCCGGIVCLAVIGGDPLAAWSAGIGLATVIVGFMVVWWSTRRGAIVNPLVVHRVITVMALAATPIGYFFGVWSPYPTVLAAALLITGLSSPPRFSRVAFAATTVGWGALCTAVTAGWVEDRGFIAPDMDVVAEIVGTLAVTMVFIACYVMGLKSRQQTEKTVAAFEDVVRQVSARDALLREARLELERAVAVGGPGRFTGQVIGDYALDILIGRGGMGEIYAANHVDSGEPAAVKLLQRGAQSGSDPIERFAREAQLVASLDSPHVVAVLAIGGADGTLPYLAMERLIGDDLGGILRDDGRLSRPKLIALAQQVATGLGAAADATIVHRDLKPQNLFLTQDGTWKILDFGVSRLAGASSTLTAGQVVGTPAYMAPEQVTTGVLDHRVDIYALGVILYRAVTGRPAFSGKEMRVVVEQVLSTLPPKPSTLRSVPEAVDDVLRVAMAKDPGDRFDDAQDLASAFTEALRGACAPQISRRAEALNRVLTWSD